MLTHDPLNRLDLPQQLVNLLLATPDVVRIEEVRARRRLLPQVRRVTDGVREDGFDGLTGCERGEGGAASEASRGAKSPN